MSATSTQCKVCADQRRGYVDSLLLGGRSMKSIEAETGLPYDSIRRHRDNHVARPSKPSSPVASTGTLAAGATPYDTMRKRVDDLNAMDPSTMSNRDRIAHSEELRRAAETLARLTPVDPSAGTVRVWDIEGAMPFFSGLFEILNEPSRSGAEHAVRDDLRRRIGELIRRSFGEPTTGEAT